ncbi:hypothetical protein BGZ94_001194, partial [Podila epigama]
MIGSAPAIPKLHPVFSTLTNLSSGDEDDTHDTNYKDADLLDKGSPSQSPLVERHASPQQPSVQGWTVRALYDFEGQSEFSELSFSAGDVLTVLKVGLADGWSLAEKGGVKGLVPDAYITATSPGDSKNHEQQSSSTTAYSSLTASTVQGGSLTNPRNSVFGKRQLNRFSWFVTTGAEEFLLTGGISHNQDHAVAGTTDFVSSRELASESHGSSERTLSSARGSHLHQESLKDHGDDDDEVTESDKHYIQSGPSWQEKAPLFQVRVHDPETRRKMVGMQEYTLFQVTSTFTQGVSVTVERRYSQFEWLYERLVNKFGALILPGLPEKQYSGRFSEEFIERRRRALERFLNRLVRHPVIRYSDLLTHFLSCNEEGDWKRAERKFDHDRIVGTSFFQHVYHPEFNVNEEGDIDVVERFQAHCKGTERLMPFLLDASQALKDGLIDSQFRYKRFGLALLNLISTTKDGPENQTLNDDLA